MRKLRYVKAVALDDLRERVPENLLLYRTGDFSFLSVDSSLWFEHGTEIDEFLPQNMTLPDGANLYEAENCTNILMALPNLSPYEARDERLWAYLTHTDLLEYTRRRWPIPSDPTEAAAHIRKHFFARDKRQIERDNSASRLWWMGHLCARVPNLELDRALQTFLFRSDVRANIIERPTTSQSVELFGAILTRLSRSMMGAKQLFERNRFRQFMREVNSVGGFKLLDCLEADQVDSVLDRIIKDRLKLDVL